ncbi:MAG: cytochrome c, mono- and diheme variant family [Cytophagaceae bacterium]|jgi:hypothetical protein|nr:cytochrome c, mono- and diheme variant family [Cytophagaceae bacterium]
MKTTFKTLLFLCSAFFLLHCQQNPPRTQKLQDTDPFQSTIVPSQFFAIDTKQDQVIEAENGTVIVCPKGCFKNASGEIVEDLIKIEISEALKLDDMLLSNLTTTSHGQPLETDGMIYFNATTEDGEQLTVNKDNPVYIEIPTKEKKAGMMVYKGSRDAKGNMNWTEPKELDKFLTPVDIFTLDLLPPNFESAVKAGMPYKQHREASSALTDSLYYSLAVINSHAEISYAVKKLLPTDYNEPYNNQNKKVVNGKYTSDSYNYTPHNQTDEISSDSTARSSDCGIDPAIIKVIKSKKYQHTLLATREFETRLKTIFLTCQNEVLEVYVKNLDKKLYELDSIAATVAIDSRLKAAFIQFQQQRLTTVKGSDKYAKLLQANYEKKLAKVKAELEKEKQKLEQALANKNEEFKNVADNYKKLLFKRESYRMEKYGFVWSETGWLNIDNGILPKTWASKPLEIKVTNGQQFDRVYTYVVFTSLKSLYRLNAKDNIDFYVGNEDEKEILMPKKESAVAIGIGYKGDSLSLSVTTFQTGSEPKLTMTLTASSIEQLKAVIGPYEKYMTENRISEDLEYMLLFYKEKQRQKALRKEAEFISSLYDIAFPCCVSSDTMSVNEQ